MSYVLAHWSPAWVLLALLLGWLAHEESDELSRELDRLTGRPPAGRPAWAASPGDRGPRSDNCEEAAWLE